MTTSHRRDESLTNDAPAVDRLVRAPKMSALLLSLTTLLVVGLAGGVAPAGAHSSAKPSGETTRILTFKPISVPAWPSGTGAGSSARAPRSGARRAFRRVRSHIVGVAHVGRMLKVRVSPRSGAHVVYQWERCQKSGRHCSRIRGATRSRYCVTRSDVGHVVMVAVKASALSGPALFARSSVTVGKRRPVAPPSNVAPPVLSGSGAVGTVLSSTAGSWQPAARRYSYAWFERASSTSSWRQIPNASGARYTVGQYAGDQVTVAVTASNDGGSSTAMARPVTVSSGSTPPPVLAPVATVAPAVSGTAVLGNVLTTSSGSWSNGPTSYAYQWEDCNSAGGSCVAISGATSSSYTIGSSDVNHRLVVVATASNSGGSASASSAATAVVPVPVSAPANTAVPTISGTAAVGNSLTAGNGSWSGSPTGYSYKWEDCNSSGGSCAAISGATASSYKVATGDENDTLKVVVTASNSAGSASASSAATSTVPTTTSGPTVNYYVAQSAAGTGNGSSCANAQAVSTLSTSTHWTPGNVIGLCGTITSAITAQGSGTSANPITVYWEPGATMTMSAPSCTSGCVNVNNRSYIVLNGGGTGVINVTNNGDQATYADQIYGIEAKSTNSVTIRKWDPLESTCRHASLSIL